MLVKLKSAVKLVQTRGVKANMELFDNVPGALFSASMWFGKACVGHAMLTPMAPGEVWPHHDKGTTIPAELTNVFVSPDLRGQGIATTLVGKCLAYCTRKNWECVLRVTPYGTHHMSVEQLVDFYKKTGFYVYARGETVHMFKAPK